MRILKLLVLVLVTAALSAAPAWAQTAANVPTNGPGIGAGIGAGLAIVGAGIGLGLIGYSALSGMARQPQILGQLQTVMLIIAALLEGVVLFALIICLLMSFNAAPPRAV